MLASIEMKLDDTGRPNPWAAFSPGPLQAGRRHSGYSVFPEATALSPGVLQRLAICW